MAKFGQGILGSLKGKIGPVIGSSWRGISYLKSKPLRKKNAGSIKQQQQRKKFGMVLRFTRPMSSLLNKVFITGAQNMTGVNAATSFIINTAIKGDFPNYSIDYSLVKIARGNLPNVVIPAATVVNHSLSITWVNNTGIGKSKDNDRAVILIYCPSQNTAIHNDTIATRGTQLLQIDIGHFRGEEVHVYLSFLSQDMKDAADSVYLGKFIVESNG